MSLDFVPILEEANKLVLYDYSPAGTINANYTSWTVTITSTTIDNPVTIDLIDYIYNDRVEDELYTITTTTLGQTGSTIADGLYELAMEVNNQDYTKTRYLIIYNNIQTELETILEEFNYNFEVSEEGTISYVDDEADTEDIAKKIRLISGLIDELQSYYVASYSTTVATEIDNIITKAERIATVLTT